MDRYLEDIGEYELITADEEKELARQIKKGSQEALEKMTIANLRFVVNVAKKYQNQGLSLSDLINEGNIGLIEAAKRFDGTKGYKFISYAVWWIRQSILQALAEQSRIVRLPLNRIAMLYKISQASKRFEQEFGRQPSSSEIADDIEMSPDKVRDLLNISLRHLSLDASFKDGESNTLLDVLEDEIQPLTDEVVMQDSLKLEINKALSTLTPKEANVISLYFGLNYDHALTLGEIGVKFNLTRERIRQIKEKAIKKLKHPKRSIFFKGHIE